MTPLPSRPTLHDFNPLILALRLFLFVVTPLLLIFFLLEPTALAQKGKSYKSDFPLTGAATGGGWYQYENGGAAPARANFGFNCRHRRGAPDGNLTFQADGIFLKSTKLVSVALIGRYAHFSGRAKLNREQGYYFQVTARDSGEPGVFVDHFTISIWEGPVADPSSTMIHSSAALLNGGNIQVRRSFEGCIDEDDDGYAAGGGICGPVDCDDEDPAISPAAIEECDGVDNDCDGTTDEGCGPVCTDGDEDGYSPEGGACGEMDCDDNDGAIHPGADEVCDSLDNDCDGTVDEELGTTTCGLGLCEHTVQNCLDGQAQICDPFAGAADEVCDSLDNDCDGTVDEELGDTTCGLGICEHTVENCLNGQAQICDPFAGAVDEICDDLDNDCDGETDEGLISVLYTDTDEDGFGDPSSSIEACAATPGYVSNDLDCDDSNGDIHPGADEIADNGIDEDCDGFDLTSQYVADWYVDVDAPPGGDGLSWSTAFDRIHFAVEAASEGDEIWVKAGTYDFMDTVSIDKKVHLFGGFAGFESDREQRDWENNVTIVSGEHFKGSGFKITADATLSGFTITQFWSGIHCGPIEEQSGAVIIENASPTISHCIFTRNRGEMTGAIYTENTSPEMDASPTISESIFRDNGSLNGGGALYNRYCSPTIRGCTFSGNTGGDVAAVVNFSSSPHISDCTFEGNHPFRPDYPVVLNRFDSSPAVSRCTFTGNAGITYEVNVRESDSATLIDDCVFTGNNPVAVSIQSVLIAPPPVVVSNSRFAANHGRKLYESYGPAISVDQGAATISRCTFERNHNGGAGGAMYIDGSTVTINDSIFKGNVTSGGGGAIKIRDGSEVTIVNSLFTNNTNDCDFMTACGGGAIFNEESSPTIMHSTFSGNRTKYRHSADAFEGGAIDNKLSSIPTIRNSIFRDNGPKDVWDYTPWVQSPSADITYSLIGFYDPNLENEASHNVDADPLFADAARDDYRLLAGSPAVDAGTTVVPVPPGLPTTDLDGNSRTLDGDEDGTALPDMGAYEYVPDVSEEPPAPPPVNTAPLAMADAMLGDEHHVKDYLDFQEHHVGDIIQLDGSGSRDEDGDPLTYHWSFVHIPSRSAAVLSDPYDEEPTFLIDANGVYAVKLVVNDGLEDSAPDILVIYTANRLPVISPAPDITVNVGEPVQLSTGQIHDPDGDPLTYQWCLSPGWPDYELPGKPQGSTITLESLRGPAPTFVPDEPGVYSFIIKPFDGYSYGRQCDYPRFFSDHKRCDYVRVYAQVSGNTPPQVTSIPSDKATVGIYYSYDVTYEDPDDSSVRFSLDVAPEGMYVDFPYRPNKILWDPAAEQLGEHDVVLRAVDQRGSYSFQHFTVTVSNDPPVILSSPITVATEAVPYAYQVEATDTDTTYLMRFYLDVSPPGMTIHSSTGLIQWVPSADQVGDHPVTVRVEDLVGASVIQSFIISVRSNRPPLIISSPQISAAEGELYLYPLRAIDEGGALEFLLEAAPDGMAINADSGLIAWTPAAADVGIHDVVLRVIDALGLTASQSYSLSVSAQEEVDHDGDTYSQNDGDCDDSNPLIYPGAFDTAGNDIDEDCNGNDAATSLRITTGQDSVVLPAGTALHIGRVIEFRGPDAGLYHIQFAQWVEPDDGTLTVETEFPSEVTATGSMAWQVNTTVTGTIPGSYELTALASVVETGQTSQVTTLVNVTDHEENPSLNTLGSYPDAVPMYRTADVLFTTVVTGTDTQPTEITVEEIDEAGSVIRTIGGLVDDGSSGDLQAGDNVYSGTFGITSGAEGIMRFAARAAFPGLDDPVCSEACGLHVTRFPTDITSSPFSTIAQDPATGAPFVTDRILVSFTAGTTPDTIETIVGAVGGQVIGTILRLGIYQVTVPDTGDETGVLDAMDALYQHPEVQSVEPVLVGLAAGVHPDDTDYEDEQEYLRHIRADEAWVVSRGGPLIAVVDSGVDYTHPDLMNKVIKGRNYMSPHMTGLPHAGWMDPMDDAGHGTRVAGLAAAITNNGNGIAGVAWESDILAVRSGAQRPIGGRERPIILYDAAVSGIRYAADKGAKVINFSSGFPQSFFDRPHGEPLPRDEIAIKRAVDYAADRGCLVVAAAGNDNTELSRDYPCVFDRVLCVGAVEMIPEGETATRWQDADLGGSNYGHHVNIAAPGDYIYSTSLNGSYNYNGGTSFSTPLVAGAAALVWASHSHWTAQRVRRRLEQTAAPLPPEEKMGSGLLDVFEAVFNGGFETGDLDGWAASSWGGDASPYIPWGVPVAHAIGRVGPLAPRPYLTPYRLGPNLWSAYLDNSGWLVWQTNLAKTFIVQPGVTSTPFSYDIQFLTEWKGIAWSRGCYVDIPQIRIHGPSGDAIYARDWALDFFMYWNQVEVDIGDPDYSFHPYNYQCGEIQYESVQTRAFRITDSISFTEGPGEYTITLSITDGPVDTIGDTAIIIDSIRFR